MAIFDSSGSQASQYSSSEPPRKAPFKKGDFIGKDYEVFDVLGEGGFGIVYLVYSHETESVYALKTFRDEYLEDTKIRERFKREAQVWIDLERHPYLVRAYLVEEIFGRLFIAMEHIASDESGMNTLEGYLKRRPPDLAQSLKWAIQFCYGMEHAYSKGVKAHRDIKPANIMIAQNKTVKITDFGLAGIFVGSSISEQGRLTGKSGNAASMQTAIGESIGTPEYMSPEQFTDLSACDERSDIYSFGMVLYQMASGGKLPFGTDNPDYRWTALKHFHQEAPPPKLNSPLFPVIQRCLEKEPGKRYQTFKDLRVDIEIMLKQLTGEIIKLPPIEELAAWELFNKGISLLLLDKDEEARDYLDKSNAINPIDVTVWNIKGLSLSRLGRYQEALVCYDKALEINPNYEMTWDCKGYTLYKLGKYNEALICFDRAVEIKPIYSFGWNQKGLLLTIIGKHKEAIDCYDKALEINPLLEDAWTNKAFSLDELGKYQEALTCCNKALEINSLCEKAWYKKGVVLDNLGKYQLSIACYDKALEINPAVEAAWIAKGNVLEELGKHEEAIVCFSKAIEIIPMNKLAWYNKGTVLKELGKHQDAIACYDKAIEIDPMYADAWNNKGFSLDELSKYQEAEACYDKALEIDPQDAAAWYNRGQSFKSIGMYKEAIEAFKNFIRFATSKYAGHIEKTKEIIKEMESQSK